MINAIKFELVRLINYSCQNCDVVKNDIELIREISSEVGIGYRNNDVTVTIHHFSKDFFLYKNNNITTKSTLHAYI